MATLHTETMDADSTNEEIEARMEELCDEHGTGSAPAFATCEVTSAGVQITITDEPQ